MESLIGKFATVKSEVPLSENKTKSQQHGVAYEIINHDIKKKWICLKSHIKVTYENEFHETSTEILKESFWMREKDCIITDNK